MPFLVTGVVHGDNAQISYNFSLALAPSGPVVAEVSYKVYMESSNSVLPAEVANFRISSRNHGDNETTDSDAEFLLRVQTTFERHVRVSMANELTRRFSEAVEELRQSPGQPATGNTPAT